MEKLDKLKTYHNVGIISKDIAAKVGCCSFGEVFAAPGVIKHITKRHSHELNKDILDNLLDIIKNIIETPDYIGKHPKKNGMEFIKRLSQNILVGIEVDISDGYIYIATLHPIPEDKINRRLYSGRLQTL